MGVEGFPLAEKPHFFHPTVVNPSIQIALNQRPRRAAILDAGVIIRELGQQDGQRLHGQIHAGEHLLHPRIFLTDRLMVLVGNAAFSGFCNDPFLGVREQLGKILLQELKQLLLG